MSHYERGIDALEKFDYDAAYLELRKAQPKMAKSDPQWLEATYAFALANWHHPPPELDTINRAIGLFNELLAADISADWKTRVRLDLGRIYEVSDFPDDVVNLEKAREFYREVQQANPTGEFGYQASLRLAQTYVQELDRESVELGVNLIQEQIARDPESPWAAVAYQYLGDLYQNSLDDSAAALSAYMHAEKIGFPNVSRTDVYLWRMAGWADELGQTPEAVRLWTRIVEEFPRSPYGTLSRDHVREYAKQHPEKGIVPPELKTW